MRHDRHAGEERTGIRHWFGSKIDSVFNGLIGSKERESNEESESQISDSNHVIS